MSTGPPPPFDPELATPLAAILADLPTMTAESIPDRRARTVAGSLTDDEIRRGGEFDVATYDVSDGVRILLCRPVAAPVGCPVVYNIHGGGMVAGNARTAELAGELRRAAALGLAVAAVEYRLAPEHPDPIPAEDCYTGLEWVARHGAGLGLDPGRVVVSGNSAGGGLAAGVALLARDRSGPPLLGMMLQCPMLDDRCDTVSARQMEDVGLWNTASNRTGWTALLGDRRGTAEVSPYAAPARADELSGLPPAFVDVGSVESLRDEAVTFCSRIWQAGGQAELHVWSGAFHSFDQWVPHAVVSRAAEDARLAWLRRLLATPQEIRS